MTHSGLRNKVAKDGWLGRFTHVGKTFGTLGNLRGSCTVGG